ncbi:MAG: hypothetical protein ACYC2S_02535 [Spirochaetales bacterium]
MKRAISAIEKRKALPCRKVLRDIALSVLLSLCGSAPVFAQEAGAPINLVDSDTIVRFGFPVFLDYKALESIGSPQNGNSTDLARSFSFDDSAGGKYLETGVILQGIGLNIPSAGDGELLFIQNAQALSGGMPAAAGNFLAIAHRDGFISLYSAKDFIPSSASKTEIRKGDSIGIAARAPGSENANYLFRLYDGKSRLWANPALFIQGFNDSVSPKITQIALLGEKETYIAENRKNVTQMIPQGSYLLAVSVVDPRYRNESISGLFRLKAVLNGQIIADKKLDSARVTENGLSFMEMQAPSSNSVDKAGRLLLGKQFLPNGKHTLEVFAYDYAGNEAKFTWQFSAR